MDKRITKLLGICAVPAVALLAPRQLFADTGMSLRELYFLDAIVWSLVYSSLIIGTMALWFRRGSHKFLRDHAVAFVAGGLLECLFAATAVLTLDFLASVEWETIPQLLKWVILVVVCSLAVAYFLLPVFLASWIYRRRPTAQRPSAADRAW